jgi:hypothetical protein
MLVSDARGPTTQSFSKDPLVRYGRSLTLRLRGETPTAASAEPSTPNHTEPNDHAPNLDAQQTSKSHFFGALVRSDSPASRQ